MSAPQPTPYVQGQGTVTADQLNTFIQTATNIAQLRTFVGIVGMVAATQGTTTAGDGGARVYYWNQTSLGPDNGSTVIVPQLGVPGAWINLGLATSIYEPLYGTGTFSGNAITATFSPAIISISPGDVFWISMTGTNTGAVTLSVGLTFLPLLSPSGAALQGGEITTGLIGVTVNTSSTAFILFMPNGTFQVAAATKSGQALNLGQFPSLIATNGYKKYPDLNSASGYFIEQWGSSATISGSVTVTFPIAFPNACLNIQATTINTGSGGSFGTLQNGTISTTQASFYSAAFGTSPGGPANSNYAFFWRAIGY